MVKKQIPVGTIFGRLTVIGNAKSTADGQAKFRCQCSCGVEVEVRSHLLRHGVTRSCGCLRRETSKGPTKHGMSSSQLYAIWANMKDRCANPRHHAYASYGGRGITVCERWLTFENFVADMGERPSAALSIDRINNDGHYEPANCRWATRSEQQRNKRRYNQHDGKVAA